MNEPMRMYPIVILIGNIPAQIGGHDLNNLINERAELPHLRRYGLRRLLHLYLLRRRSILMIITPWTEEAVDVTPRSYSKGPRSIKIGIGVSYGSLE